MENAAKPNPSHRWFRVWLGLGGALAALMLVNSMLNYTIVSRRIVTMHVSRQIRDTALKLDRRLQQTGPVNNAALRPLLEEVTKDRDNLAWIEIRTRDGIVTARHGLHTTPSFTDREIHDHVLSREPVAKTRHIDGREAQVEVLPIRIPVDGKDDRPGIAHVEAALWLDSANAVFWPLRRNMILNCSAAAALMGSLILLAFHFRSYIRGRQLERELEIAHRVQCDLLPPPDASPDVIRTAAECIPASGVGGDLYDVFPTDNGGFALVIGDVSGKGMPAALLMGVLHGAIRSSDWHSCAAAHQLATQRLNRLLCDRASGERYATLFWSSFDPLSGTLAWINAGHCPPLLIRRGRDSQKIMLLDEGGPVLGLLRASRYEQAHVQLNPGDTVVLYSDGVLDAVNAVGQEFGIERFYALLEDTSGNDPDTLRSAILTSIRSFAGSAPLPDDLTLVVVRYDGPKSSHSSRNETSDPVQQLT